jgi:exopolyphosphatase / guanosine-5'-triphosphate,3'-diphosphate pyrophosphatase
MPTMRAGVIDVGSNTVRLLVVKRSRRGLAAIETRRAHLGMGDDIERCGSISDRKLDELGELVATYVAAGRKARADRLEAVVTAPGRQSSNGDALREVVRSATGLPVRQLSAEDEGRLAYAGAVQGCGAGDEPVGVVDVGGGSTQLMVGTADAPSWLHCLDLGSLRLTSRYVAHDPPLEAELSAAAEAVEGAFEHLTPPIPRTVLATGGTARSLRRIAGRRLGADDLGRALATLAGAPAVQVARAHGVPVERARVLPAGTIVLREVQRRLGVKLEVARGGLREGVVLELLAELAAAA